MPKESEAGLGMYVRLPDAETREKFKAYARSKSRSMNGEIVEMIKAAINPPKAPSRPKPTHSGER